MEHPDFKNFLSRVRTSDWPLHIEAHSGLGHSGRVAMRIAVDGELFGIIWVTDTARPLNDQDYAAIRQAAGVAAAICAREHLATQREAMLRAELLEDVIKGRISNPENDRTVALSVGWNIDRLQQALVVAIDDFEAFRLRRAGHRGAAWRREQERLMELVKLEVLAIDPDAVVGMRSSSVVVLLDVGQEPGSERKATAIRLAESVELKMSHYHYDVFQLTLDRIDLTMLVSFGTDKRGTISTLMAPIEATLNDIVFERQPDEAMSDPQLLATFTGTYEVMGSPLVIELSGRTLCAGRERAL